MERDPDDAAARARARALAGVATYLALVCGVGWSAQGVLLIVAGQGVLKEIGDAVWVCIELGSFTMLAGALAAWWRLGRSGGAPRAELLLVAGSGFLAGAPVLVLMAWGVMASAVRPPSAPVSSGPFGREALALNMMCVNWTVFPLAVGLLAAYVWLRHRAHLD